MIDPELLPSVARPWKQLCLARAAAYTQPWSHEVLRALELSELPRGRVRQVDWLSERLAIPAAEVQRSRRGYGLERALVVNTAQDAVQARASSPAGPR